MGFVGAKSMGYGIAIFASLMNHTRRLRLAFAATWNDDRSKTWSGTPHSLETALQQRDDVDCIDTPIHIDRRLIAAARVAYVRRTSGEWKSQYRIAPLIVRVEEKALIRAVTRQEVDVALLIGDLGVPPVPFMNYFDHTFLHFNDNLHSGRYDVRRLRVYTPRLLQRHIKRQLANLNKASALISMSHWDADFLKQTGSVDPNRVFVVPPGRNAAGVRAPFSEKIPGRLLFVGSDFNTKAGEQVVRAFTRLRASVDYDATLVIAGPATWPMQGDIPDGVEFLGTIPYQRVHEQMQKACGFVMPSIFEAYGIVFLEALGEGIPVIGRKACAMPEFIAHGSNGLLIDEDDFGDVVLAEYMHRLCTDMELRKRVYDDADHIAHQVSWERAAEEMVRLARWSQENPQTSS